MPFVDLVTVKDANNVARDVPTLSASNAYNPLVTITRPANATPYTAGDIVGGPLALANAGDTGKSILVTGASLELDIAGVPSGMTGFRLHLYDVSPASALSDNALFDLPSGDRAAYLGYIDIDAPINLGSTCFAQVDAIGKQVKLSSASLYAYLVTLGGYTPGSGDVYKLRLKTLAV